MFLNLSPQRASESFVIPARFKFRLPRGSAIGGVIQNGQGEPIEGARVELGYKPGQTKNENLAPSFFGDDVNTTDAQGRWHCDTVAPGDDVKVSVTARHTDYVS